MNDNQTAALELLLDALERRTSGLLPRQFESMVSPRMADAFVKGWIAVGRNVDDIPGEWREMADTYAQLD